MSSRHTIRERYALDHTPIFVLNYHSDMTCIRTISNSWRKVKTLWQVDFVPTSIGSANVANEILRALTLQPVSVASKGTTALETVDIQSQRLPQYLGRRVVFDEVGNLRNTQGYGRLRCSEWRLLSGTTKRLVLVICESSVVC